jgi:hypothetical protein
MQLPYFQFWMTWQPYEYLKSHRIKSVWEWGNKSKTWGRSLAFHCIWRKDTMLNKAATKKVPWSIMHAICVQEVPDIGPLWVLTILTENFVIYHSALYSLATTSAVKESTQKSEIIWTPENGIGGNGHIWTMSSFKILIFHQIFNEDMGRTYNIHLKR